MKTYFMPRVRKIIVILLVFCFATCTNNITSVPEADYQTKIVGHWQGTVGHLKETMSLKSDGTFFCKLDPIGFIGNTLFQGMAGSISGTWKLSGAIITLRITSSENEHLTNRIVSSTIVVFKKDEIVLKAENGVSSPFRRVRVLWPQHR